MAVTFPAKWEGTSVYGYDAPAMLALKLYALVVMVADHADWLLFDSSLGIHDTIGRTVFPVFGLVLALNLARTDDWRPLLYRVAPRMALWGAIATLPYAYLAGWSHFNVLFTLAASVACVAAILRGWYIVAVAIVLAAGLTVDYSYFGILYVVGAWAIIRHRFPPELALIVGAVLLWPINASWWAAVAMPLAYYARITFVGADAPRLKWAFYAAYPAHLLVLAIIKGIG
jgi:hypothetical protein